MTHWSELSDAELARLAAGAEHDLPDAPPWLVEAAFAMWRAPAPVPTLGERIAAVLGFDSWALQGAPALRSGRPDVRQLLFTAGARDIDLRLSPDDTPGRAGPRFTIAGQILGPGEGGVVALAAAGGGPTLASVALDEFGEFRFADLPAAPYALSLSFGDDRIVLPDIDLGGEPRG